MSMCAAVHRKGFSMMQNKFLLAMMESKNEEYVFYRAQVNSEMTKALTYFVKLVLLQDGSVAEASCECIAGKGTHAVCKHVAVVCYTLLHFKEQGRLMIRDTCTGRNQVWHMPKKTRLEISPKKAENITYAFEEYNANKKNLSNLCYDPRPICYKNLPSYNDDVRNLVVNYSSRQKRCLGISGTFSAASVEGIINDHDYLLLPALHQMIYNRIQVTKEEAENIEKATRNQNNSAWFQERSIRLIASNVGTIVHMTSRKNVDSFVDSIINPKPFKSAATDWGKLNEKNAVSAYEKVTTNKVVSCGLFISLDKHYLAATPDGLVQLLTVLEVKCPYSIKDSAMSTDALSYLEMKNDSLSLKQNSNYYYQVQTQMYATGREFCDFVIWTPKDYKCISVDRDNDMINNIILPKLKEFYDKYMVPALAKKYYSM